MRWCNVDIVLMAGCCGVVVLTLLPSPPPPPNSWCVKTMEKWIQTWNTHKRNIWHKVVINTSIVPNSVPGKSSWPVSTPVHQTTTTAFRTLTALNVKHYFYYPPPWLFHSSLSDFSLSLSLNNPSSIFLSNKNPFHFYPSLNFPSISVHCPTISSYIIPTLITSSLLSLF